MYSVVLMMAMSSSPEMVAFGGRRGCNGGGCYGGGCHGYNGGCNGCDGGNGCHGRRGGFFGGRKHGCNGCNGGWACGGGGCHGNWGGCRGNWGGGSCYGGSGWGGGCYGGAGMGYGCQGGMMMAQPMQGQAMPQQPQRPAEGAPAPRNPGDSAMFAAPATIVVSLPADAKLTFDGRPTTSTDTVRRFVTPKLETGLDHTYTLSAQVVRNGQTLNTTQVVTVRAGQTSEVNMTDASFAATLAMR